MTITQWATDDEITSARLNEMVNAINATTDGPLTIVHAADVYALTVQNTHTNGKAFRILSMGGTPFVFAARASNGNNVLTISDTTSTVVTNSILNVAKNTNGHYVAADFVLDATGTGGPASQDAGAMRAVTTQQNSGGNSLLRAGEFHARRYAPAIDGGTWCLELNMSTTVTGSADNSNLGIFMQSGNGTVGEVAGNTGIWMGGPAGWNDYIICKATDNTTNRFKVDSNGGILCGTITPRTATTFTSGTAGAPWSAVVSQTFNTSFNGSPGSPNYVRQGVGTVGLYIGAATCGLAIGASDYVDLTSSGLALEKSLITKHQTPSTPASGYSALAATAANTWQTKDSTGATASLLTSLNTGRRNRLVNGDMRVKQRATMPTTDDNYCLDRWILLLEAANAATVDQETSDVPTNGSNRAIKLTVGSANNNKFGVVQPLEAHDSRDLRGKSVSLQFKMKSTAGITNVRAAVIEWTGTADVVTSDVVSTWGAENTNPTLATNWAYCSGYTPVSLAATTSWATYKIENVTVGASTNNLGVFIWVDDETTTQTTDILRITDVQLEEGAVCTQVERRSYAQDLDDCEFWLQALGGTNGQVPFYQVGSSTSTTLADFGPIIRRQMRVAPTLSVTVGDWAVLELGSPIACTALSIVYSSPRGLWLRATVAAGLTAGRAVALGPLNTGGFTQLLLSSEL